MTATNSRADKAAGRSRTNQRPPPPPILSSHSDQHPEAVEPYRQRNPGTLGSPRATIGRQPAPQRCPNGSKPEHGRRSTRSDTATHRPRNERTNGNKHQPANIPGSHIFAPALGAFIRANHADTAERRARTETAAPSRPAVFPEFLPP